MLNIINLNNCSTTPFICQSTADIFAILYKGCRRAFVQNDNLPKNRFFTADSAIFIPDTVDVCYVKTACLSEKFSICAVFVLGIQLSRFKNSES